MKALVGLAPLCFIALVYALIQSDWSSALSLVFIEILILVCYRNEKRLHDGSRASQGR